MTDKAKVAIIMGSDSDLKIMKDAAMVLEDFDIPFYMDIMSAHRTPEIAAEFSSNAHKNGIKVIIAAAGLAAHLAGAIAGHSPLPVIGVPIAGGKLQGIDSLLSTVQMPPGVPVATVAVNGAKNAALLAIQMLATGDDNLLQKFIDFKEAQAVKVRQKSDKLKQDGWKTRLD